MFFYDEDERMEVDSPKDIEMEAKGYLHVANFRADAEPIIRELADKYGLDIVIVSECYDVYGKPINDPSLRALYRSTHVDEDAWMKFTAEREKLLQEFRLI